MVEGRDKVLYFQNGQWAVTNYGLEADRPSAPVRYSIPAEKLLKLRGVVKGSMIGLSTLPQKPGPLAAFREAYEKVLEIHQGRYPETVDQKVLEATLREAERIKARQ